MRSDSSVSTRVLITGGTGFVGPHLIRLLRAKNNQIAVLSSDKPSTREPGVKYYEADIRDGETVGAVVRETRPEHVYHLAGISAVDTSWRNSRLTYEVNVMGSFNVFEAAMSLPSPPRILNVSSSQVYAGATGKLTEKSPLQPDNPYAVSKAMTELLAVQFGNCKNGGIITARSFNHTGPGQSPTFVLPSIAKQFAEIESGLRPPKLSLGNIQVKRDFTDVRDVVRAYALLLERGKPGEVYNVCSGRSIRLADLIDLFQSVAGVEIDIECDPAKLRANEAAEICGDPRKIHSETGWLRQISLEQTVADLLEYFRAQSLALAG